MNPAETILAGAGLRAFVTDAEWLAIARRMWPVCLSSNLAIAGALCRAHEIGGDSAMEHHWLGKERIAPSERTLKRKRVWAPGCGRPA